MIGSEMTLNDASLIVRGSRRNCEGAVEKIFTVLIEARITPMEAEAVLIRAWEKVFAKGILCGPEKQEAQILERPEK